MLTHANILSNQIYTFEIEFELSLFAGFSLLALQWYIPDVTLET